jgi:hypothetical protein
MLRNPISQLSLNWRIVYLACFVFACSTLINGVSGAANTLTEAELRAIRGGDPTQQPAPNAMCAGFQSCLFACDTILPGYCAQCAVAPGTTGNYPYCKTGSGPNCNCTLNSGNNQTCGLFYYGETDETGFCYCTDGGISACQDLFAPANNQSICGMGGC